jgi:hypothetical protein
LAYDSCFVVQMKFFKEINQKKLEYLKDNQYQREFQI